MRSLPRTWLLALAQSVLCVALAHAQDAQSAPSPEPDKKSAEPPEVRADAAAQPDKSATPGDVQVISDPELDKAGATSSDVQVISDPELDQAGASSAASSSGFGPSEAGGGNAEARIALHSRMAADVHRTDPRQDVWDSLTIGTLDVTVRRSDKVRFVLGLRMRYHYAALAADVPDSVAGHYELDAMPTAGYADLKLGDGLHLQLGYQPVHLGRFDVLSATNFLSAHDLRDGPAALPETSELGQIAAVCDYDANSWLSFRAVYLPFFMPHVISVMEGDYALLRATQAQADAVVESIAGSDPLAQARFRNSLRQNLTRGARDSIAQSGLAAFAPQPSFTEPQGALRATAHGPAGEVAVTAGTALEHLPALRLSPYFGDTSLEGQARLAADPKPVTVEYNRFAVFSADAETNLGPFSVGVESAYMMHRTFMAVPEVVGTTVSASAPGTSDVLQLGARAEYVHGEEWLFALESFFAYALQRPSEGPRHWLFMEDGRYARGVAGMIGWKPTAIALHFEVGGGLLSGPSWLLAPRVGYPVVENFEVEVGALFIGGKHPPSIGNLSTQTYSLGGLYNNVNQVYLGVRYLP